MDKKLQNRLIDMKNYSAEAINFLGDLTYEEFLIDRKTMFSVVRAIEVAAKLPRKPGERLLKNFRGLLGKKL